MKPYLTGDAAGARREDIPFDREFGSDFGVDAKVGITSGLTADLTWNTDFAQVEADAQQINLTRFSLFFPEKREFFLEGQGLFAFGTSERTPRASARRFGAPSSVPLLFFSRRIGIAGNQLAPIRGGARVTGKLGDFGVGALAMRSGENAATGAPGTDFSVVRLKRDILGRSTVGLMGTHRSDAGGGLGSNTAYGMDARFGFYENLDIRSYAAWTKNEHEERTGMSYRGQFDYQADRYGLQLERLVVGEGFDPGIGFLRRRDFERNYAEARFSPRPRSIAWLRKIGGTGSLDYTTDTDGNLETRILALRSDAELENGDSFQFELARNREVLHEEFRLADDLAVAVGAHDFETARLSYRAGPQRPVSGNFAYQQGGFFSGTRRELAWRGRLEVIPHFIVEPTVSLNWITLPGGVVRHPAGCREAQLQPFSPELSRRLSPVQQRREQPLHEHPVPLGVPAGQRLLSRLQLAAGHADARVSRTRHPVVHRQVHPSVPFLTGSDPWPPRFRRLTSLSCPGPRSGSCWPVRV